MRFMKKDKIDFNGMSCLLGFILEVRELYSLYI